MHGVKRVALFCLMTAVLPTILIITPLYLRHSVFADVTYAVAETDMVEIMDGISSLFCESHSLRMNASFNAFQLRGRPPLSSKRKHIRLKKSMTLPDDTLEYWGFFLLKGATVSLKVCSRYEGSRILVVRGERNLKTCGLLEHNLKKFGATMDQEHDQVKVFFETTAQEILDTHNATLVNKAQFSPDSTEEMDNEEVASLYVKNKLSKRHNYHNTTHKNLLNNTSDSLNQQTVEDKNNKRHARKKFIAVQEQLYKLQQELHSNEKINFHISRPKRETGLFLNGGIGHGGNARNHTHDNSAESSVSSFETSLLQCYNGQILLTQGFSPSHLCTSVHYLEKGNHMETIHEVATDGYYYYIFYSDNDFVSNDIHAIFDIFKPTYQYANISKTKSCVNKTECAFPIAFWSDESVFVEVLTRDGIEHEADDITFLISTCHPRMAVYIIFPVSVLFLILGCAFL